MKKRVLSIVCAILISTSAAACGSTGTSDTDYQSLLDQNAALQSQVEALQAQLEATPDPTPTPAPTPTPEPTPSPEPEMTEEEFKAACTVGYDYKTLARDPKTYIGSKAMFRGEVIQVMEDSGITVLRVNVTQNEWGYWEDTMYVWYIPEPDEPRILEDDIVTMYGEMQDLMTYETIMGGTVTIPQLYAHYIDIE